LPPSLPYAHGWAPRSHQLNPALDIDTKYTVTHPNNKAYCDVVLTPKTVFLFVKFISMVPWPLNNVAFSPRLKTTKKVYRKYGIKFVYEEN